jgi:hypothetical protein
MAAYDEKLGDKHDHVVELLHDSESTTRLTDWENTFMDDLRDRVVRYGADTIVSEKQWAVLKRIEAKLYGL